MTRTEVTAEDAQRFLNILFGLQICLALMVLAPMFTKCYNKQILRVNIVLLVGALLLWVVAFPLAMMGFALVDAGGNDKKKEMAGMFVYPIVTGLLLYYNWNKTRCK